MRIRKVNVRSTKAAEKLPYVTLANETRKQLWEAINQGEDIYNLYEISKDNYTLYAMRQQKLDDEQQRKEA